MKQLYFMCLCLLACTTGISQGFKMVAIGSSTTAGTGAWPPESSWVGRFIQYYKIQQGIASDVYNLGSPGATCYRGMPGSYTPPPFREAPDPARNVTKAVQLLAGLPDPAQGVIIVGYPSNGYYDFTIPEIMQCLQVIYDSATRLGNRCFISTTQPRTDGGFGTSVMKRKFADIKDSIINRFGTAHTINFWDGFINPADSTIKPEFSAGDNVHMNNDGHQLLFERVKAANVFGASLPVRLYAFSASLKNDKVCVQWTAAHDAANDVFDIERSVNGIHFESLGRVSVDKEAGKQSYTFWDGHPVPGNNYYRIGFLNTAYQKEYSKLALVKLAAPSFKLDKLSAVPAAQSLHLEVKVDALQMIDITIANAAGVILQRKQVSVKPGSNTLRVPHAFLQRGVYHVRLVSDRGTADTRSIVY
ncbi:SGNH/GDSL hydrolase family protein [Paraflavitalea sp. CAU 1676]|uniref:SGNH/GDSL hydrolase family protein n=1 Tax=Paraflavitalea sp. CAU 1676 TaxID=3032598 RepID=UPI0023DBE5A0|nr:SGNH/GDSL hydrolase family protein [Paraflavitalea sp. CAU 1676]MDF2192138.1 SGNH/GDSL hydrolase family protein [Paraflavitalea sp. CAU 1676]